MKYKITRGDLFSAIADLYAHGCNTFGVWGAGIAAAFKVRHQAAYNKYAEHCMLHSHKQLHGTCFITMGVACLFTQYGMRADKELMRDALLDLIEQADAEGLYRIAMPAIGTGIGGLDFTDLEEVLESLPHNERMEVTIYVLDW